MPIDARLRQLSGEKDWYGMIYVTSSVSIVIVSTPGVLETPPSITVKPGGRTEESMQDQGSGGHSSTVPVTPVEERYVPSPDTEPEPRPRARTTNHVMSSRGDRKQILQYSRGKHKLVPTVFK